MEKEIIQQSKFEELPISQPFISGCFEKYIGQTALIGDLIQVIAPKMFFNNYVGIVNIIYSSMFSIIIKNFKGEKEEVVIDPLSQGWYWNDVKIKKYDSIEDFYKQYDGENK